MVLQTLFAAYALVPAITASPPPQKQALLTPAGAVARVLGITHSTISITGGRRFSAEVFTPKSTSSEAKYPGAIIIATDETRDRAFLVATKISEIGVTVIMYVQESYATHRLRVYDAKAAVDSMRHRYDVRPEEVGVVALEEATTVVPDLVKDTTLNFAIAASATGGKGGKVNAKYAQAKAATLVVQGVRSLGDSAQVAEVTSQVTTVDPTPVSTSSASASSDSTAHSTESSPDDTLAAVLDTAGAITTADASTMPSNVTVWPVPREQLESLGDAHSPLSFRMVSWVREQVHANPVAKEQQPIVVH